MGKTRPWTASVNDTSIDTIYKGKTKAVVEQVFGKADKTQGGWLGYTGMNVKGPKGEAYTTVWFGIANDIVQQYGSINNPHPFNKTICVFSQPL